MDVLNVRSGAGETGAVTGADGVQMQAVPARCQAMDLNAHQNAGWALAQGSRPRNCRFGTHQDHTSAGTDGCAGGRIRSCLGSQGRLFGQVGHVVRRRAVRLDRNAGPQRQGRRQNQGRDDAHGDILPSRGGFFATAERGC